MPSCQCLSARRRAHVHAPHEATVCAREGHDDQLGDLPLVGVPGMATPRAGRALGPCLRRGRVRRQPAALGHGVAHGARPPWRYPGASRRPFRRKGFAARLGQFRVCSQPVHLWMPAAVLGGCIYVTCIYLVQLLCMWDRFCQDHRNAGDVEDAGRCSIFSTSLWRFFRN